MKRWRRGHRPGLDGVRGIAVSLVLISHAAGGASLFALGSAGVTAFFTLSGFLITSLLLEESAGTGRVSLSAFYLRRARRLFPALAAVLLIVGLIQAIDGSLVVPQFAAVALYFGNWYGAAHHTLGAFGHTWSLAVEEQFYILWPLIVIGLRWWRSGLLVVTVAGILASTMLRFALWDGGAGADRIYLGSDTQAASLLIGCLLAILARRGLGELHAPWLPGVGVALLASLALFGGNFAAATLLVPTLVPVLAAPMIWAACSAPPAWLCSPVARYLGCRSYALYLWHFPILLLAHNRGPLAVLGALVATFAASELSWRLVEHPVMAWRTTGVRAPART